MFYCTAFLTLLVLAWTAQANSNCNGKPLTPEMQELFAVFDKMEGLLLSLLRSSNHKSQIKVLKEKMKSKFCDMDTSRTFLQFLKDMYHAICIDIENRRFTEDEIIEYLNKDPITHFNQFFSHMMETIYAEFQKLQEYGH